jgi:hypothetical protein
MEFECWTSGGQTFRYKAGEFMPDDTIEINNDGPSRRRSQS